MSSRTLWMVIGMLLAFGLVLLVWLFGPGWQPPEDHTFAELPTDTSATVGLAAVFPEGGTLQGPVGAASDGRRVFVALSDGGTIVPLARDGGLEASMTLPVVSAAPQVAYPTDVAIEGDRIAYVDSAGSGAVVVIRASGAAPARIGRDGEGELVQPTAVAAGGGEVFVADAVSRTIKVFDWDGTYKRSIGEQVDPALEFVGGMELDGDRLWVADSNTGRVFALDPITGQELAALSGQMSLPRGLTTDDSGHLFVADEFDRVVRVYDESGALVDEVGGAGMARTSEGGRLDSPRDVVWQDGRLWVVDGQAGKIRVYNVRLP